MLFDWLNRVDDFEFQKKRRQIKKKQRLDVQKKWKTGRSHKEVVETFSLYLHATKNRRFIIIHEQCSSGICVIIFLYYNFLSIP